MVELYHAFLVDALVEPLFLQFHSGGYKKKRISRAEISVRTVRRGGELFCRLLCQNFAGTTQGIHDVPVDVGLADAI